eukprot:scaffold259025_cov34-Tisochrysis_lutea.AAC.3
MCLGRVHYTETPIPTKLLPSLHLFFNQIALVRPWNCAPGPSYGGGGERDAASVFLGLSAFSYAFGGHGVLLIKACYGGETACISLAGVVSHAASAASLRGPMRTAFALHYHWCVLNVGLYPEEMREMRTPSAWPSVMHWTYGLTMPLYWLCGALGYFAYGDYSLANINLNFPRNPANTLSIVVQLVRTFHVLDSCSRAQATSRRDRTIVGAPSSDLARLQPPVPDRFSGQPLYA